MTREHLSWPDDDLDAQAAYWWTILHRAAPCPTQEKAHQLWLDENPLHEQAYQSLCDLYDASLDLKSDPELLNLRREALLPRKSIFARLAKLLPKTAFAKSQVATACLVLLTITGFAGWPFVSKQQSPIAGSNPSDTNQQHSSLRDFRTGTGERSAVELEDNSRIELSTETQVQVGMTPKARSLILQKGQALFDVAKDANRPFIVYAAGYQIKAVGTRFEVRMVEDDVQVTLLEGKVSVTRPINPALAQLGIKPKTIQVLPQQKFDSALGKVEMLTNLQAERLLSWRSGRLDFEVEPLSVVVQEINRYSTKKIILSDPTLNQLLISGSFKVGSAERFAEALTIAYPMTKVISDTQTSVTIGTRE